MRKLMLGVVVLVACSKKEVPPADTAATSTAVTQAATSATPAPLTPAMVAGTWKGESKPEGRDSTMKFTTVSVTDSTGKFIPAGAKDGVPYTVKFDGDSMIATSAPYLDPTVIKGAKITFLAVGRLRDGKLVGTATDHLAAKPDSTVGRATWEATKAP